MKTLIARAGTGDVVVFMATVNRIADILAAPPGAHACEMGAADPDAAETVDVRRARAIGILAQPAKALQLLLAHREQPDAYQHAEPTTELGSGPQPESEPEPEWDPDQSDGSGLWLPDLNPRSLRPRELAPQIVLHYHLADAAIHAGHGQVRPGDHTDPISLTALREWLTNTGCSIQVRPVFDPTDVPAVDRYEIPTRLRAAHAIRNLADVFPYGGLTTRADIDHTTPYDQNGPPGQTSLDNTGPLSRTSHRANTIGRWRKRQPHPGTYLWRSPHRWIWVVTNQGTLCLGDNPYSRRLWRAARSPSGPLTLLGAGGGP